MGTAVERLPGAAFLAFPGMEPQLADECSSRLRLDMGGCSKYGSLFYFPEYAAGTGAGADGEVPYWCRTALQAPLRIHFESIKDAAEALRAMQRSWAPYQYTNFRRAALLQEKLPYINAKKRTFPCELPNSPIGLYTLLDAHTMLASAATTSVLPAGTLEWVEDHELPPSRAYLKLWEGLTLARHFFGVPLPGPASQCLDAGAAPGGWTWALTQLGAQVLAVDRAELAPPLMADPLVTFYMHDAFTLKPADMGEYEWVCSDVICYPERLLAWVRAWLESGLARNLLCTIKLQGQTDWGVIAQFASLPRSRVVHLNANKHELTFIHCG